MAEHPKNIIDYLKDTDESVRAFAEVRNVSREYAVLILILNELRCIHWHFDVMMPKKELGGKEGGKEMIEEVLRKKEEVR